VTADERRVLVRADIAQSKDLAVDTHNKDVVSIYPNDDRFVGFEVVD
jgi:hypothetical protein